MKKLLVAILFLSACTTLTKREPQSGPDLLTDLTAMKADVESGFLSAGNCHTYLQQKLGSLTEERIQDYPAASAQSISQLIMQTTWQIRLALHRRLNDLISCRDDLRPVFYQLRSIEDLASLRYYPVEQKTVDDFPNGMQDEPIPLVDNGFYDGYLGPSGQIEKDVVQFQSGDVMISTGGSFFSGVLKTITVQPEQLDHFVLVHKDDKGILETIESYAQTSPSGVQRFAMNYALKNENPRIQLFRAKDSVTAAKAAQIMEDAVIASEKDPTKQIGYDYTISFADDKRMTCSGVTYWGFLKASNGSFVIPEEKSPVIQNLTQIYHDTGIKPDPMMTAADLEVDSRFDMLLEFRDHRLVLDVNLRDAVAKSLFTWMSEKNYKMLGSIDSWVAGGLTNATHLWPGLSKFTGIPPDAPKGFIQTLQRVNDIGAILYKRLKAENLQFFQKTGWNMTHAQMMYALESYRQGDYQRCMTGKNPELHFYFSPVDCVFPGDVSP